MSPIEIDPSTGAPIIVGGTTAKSEAEPKITKSEKGVTKDFTISKSEESTKKEEMKNVEVVNDEIKKVEPKVPPKGTEVLIDEARKRNQLLAQNQARETNPKTEVKLNVNNAKLNQIQAILRGSGLDSMSQQKTFTQIKEVIEKD